MFKLGKNKSAQQARTVSVTPENEPDVSDSIHVMPKKFYVTTKKSNKGLLIIIIVGVLIIGGLAAAAIFLNLSLTKKQTPIQNLNLNVNSPVNSNVGNVNTNAGINTNANIGTETEITTSTDNFATTTDPDLNINANVNVNVGIDPDDDSNPGIEVTPLPSAPDSDSDGLTLEEENLYGTDPVLADSDSDGFTDGSEVLNGYDPARPNQTLVGSGIFTVYTNPLYSINHPAAWQLRQQNNNTETLFISNTGEFVSIIIIENPDNLPLAEWYSRQYPEINVAQATSLRLNNFSGYRHPDNRIYFLTRNGDNSRVLMINYNVGNFSLTNFATTFNAMVKSLQ